jgi:intein/homing endonuclease
MIYETVVGRNKDDLEQYGTKASGYIGKHIVGTGEDAHTTVKIFLDLLRPHVMLISGKRGTGKCVLPDEKILLSDGSLISAESLYSKLTNNSTKNVKEINVVSISNNLKQTFCKVTQAYKKRIKEKVLVIKTKSGRKISVTKEHPLLVLNHIPQWVRAGNIKCGSYIAVPRNLKVQTNQIKLLVPKEFKKVKFLSPHPRKMKLLELLCKRKVISFDEVVKKVKHRTDALALISSLKKSGFIKILNNPAEICITQKGMDYFKSLIVKDYYSINEYTYPIKIPTEVNEELAEFFGYLISEGSEFQNVIKFTNLNSKLKNLFKSLSLRLFGLKLCTNYRDVYIESKNLAELLKRWGYNFGQHADKKEIPNFILNSGEKIVARFLRAFCDGEAYISKDKNRIEITTASKKLAEQLVYLFLRLDIFPVINEKTISVKNNQKTYYQIGIFGVDNLRKFYEKIGFNHPDKSKALKKLISNPGKNVTRLDVIPTIGKILKDTRKILNLKQRDLGIYQIVGAFENNRRNLTRKRLSYFLSKLEKHFGKIKKNFEKNELQEIEKNLSILQNLASSDIFWDKVEKIEEVFYDGYVYDFSVEKTHNFIAGFGGVVSHNSYSAGVILEEICCLEKEFKEKTAAVVFDPMGIYWSMKLPNEHQQNLLKEWDLEPKSFKEVKVYVPFELKEAYEKVGIPVDFALSISPREFSPEDWILAFNLERTSEFAVCLERAINFLLDSGKNFDLQDIVKRIEEDKQASQHVKNVLISFFDIAKSWGIFSKEGMKIEDIVKPGQVSVIDLSRARGEEWGLRNLVAAWITRKVYRERVIARKEEELAKVEKREAKKIFPTTWLIFEEAQNFCPSDRKTVSTDAILTIARQGREPGVSLVVITQMPNKVHQDILSQCDLVISHRLTSKDDLEALHSVMQSYVKEELWKYLNSLPRWPGSAIVLDDNLERIFTIQIRPRLSWHSGGTARL